MAVVNGSVISVQGHPDHTPYMWWETASLSSIFILCVCVSQLPWPHPASKWSSLWDVSSHCFCPSFLFLFFHLFQVYLRKVQRVFNYSFLSEWWHIACSKVKSCWRAESFMEDPILRSGSQATQSACYHHYFMAEHWLKLENKQSSNNKSGTCYCNVHFEAQRLTMLGYLSTGHSSTNTGGGQERWNIVGGGGTGTAQAGKKGGGKGFWCFL